MSHDGYGPMSMSIRLTKIRAQDEEKEGLYFSCTDFSCPLRYGHDTDSAYKQIVKALESGFRNKSKAADKIADVIGNTLPSDAEIDFGRGMIRYVTSAIHPTMRPKYIKVPYTVRKSFMRSIKKAKLNRT